MFFAKRNTTPTINLALQGGGAHGAFTWGVLDYLLEDGRLRFEGLSGTSAGTMNAVAFAHGMMEGGNDGARAALEKFWTAIANSLPFEVMVPSLDGEKFVLSPSLKLMLSWTHYFSPDQLNPYDLNPLRDVLIEQIDFKRLRKKSPVKLFIAATNANSGKLRVFRSPEISVDAVLASACLPMVHRTIEIDGEPYWDGGYAANPAVFPLFYECDAPDIMLVLLSPLKHKETPHTAKEINTRIMELAFRSTFLREMRVFAYLRGYVKQSFFQLGSFERRISRANFHMIEAEDVIGELSAETKLGANMRFFEMLKDLGRERAKAWLKEHYADVGNRSSVEVAKLFL